MPFNATLDIDGKKIMSNNATFTIKEDKSLTITCNTRGGRPKPKLSWYIKKFNRNIKEVTKSDEGFDIKIDETALGNLFNTNYYFLIPQSILGTTYYIY